MQYEVGIPASQALRLAELGIPVVPGSWVTTTGRCSCGDRGCRRPGAHPRDARWPVEATTDQSIIGSWWGTAPRASIIVPLSDAFAVVDTAAEAGALALRLLEQAGHRAPPVAVLPAGRYQFWVPVSVGPALATRLARTGERAARAAVSVWGPGRYVVAPPGERGPFRWERPVTQAPAALPAAEPLVDALAVASVRWSADVARGLSPLRRA